jgi:hypothetical protein
VLQATAPPNKDIERLAREAIELRNIFAAARRTLRKRLERKQ